MLCVGKKWAEKEENASESWRQGETAKKFSVAVHRALPLVTKTSGVSKLQELGLKGLWSVSTWRTAAAGSKVERGISKDERGLNSVYCHSGEGGGEEVREESASLCTVGHCEC